MLDLDMKNQIDKCDKKAHKIFVQLIDSRFPILVNKLIEIINHMLKSENWTK